MDPGAAVEAPEGSKVDEATGVVEDKDKGVDRLSDLRRESVASSAASTASAPSAVAKVARRSGGEVDDGYAGSSSDSSDEDEVYDTGASALVGASRRASAGVVGLAGIASGVVAPGTPTIISQVKILSTAVDQMREDMTKMRATMMALERRIDSGFARIVTMLSNKKVDDDDDSFASTPLGSSTAGDELDMPRLRSITTVRGGGGGGTATSPSTRSYSLGASPSPRKITSESMALPTHFESRIWVGTWNVGAKDPFGADTNDKPEHLLESGFVTKGMDLYVLCIQEGVSDDVYDTFAKVTATVRLNLSAKKKGVENPDRVLGRGDGSFVSQKFTGIAVFAPEATLPQLRVLGVDRHSFGKTEGSKGGAVVGLQLRTTTLAFVSCHLASKKSSMRLAQYKDLSKVLGSRIGNEFFQLQEQFHHVIWAGDFNYRCKGIEVPAALDMLSRGDVLTLFEGHDEMNMARREVDMFYGCQEPPVPTDFLPTYKKFEDRPAVDRSKPDWVSHMYRTAYKEPLYKGGFTKSRIPGWCDRIVYGSLKDVRDNFVPALDLAEKTTYKSINDLLTVSDHSPVSCIFNLHSPTPHAPVPKAVDFTLTTTPVRISLRVFDIEYEDNMGRLCSPKLCKVLFPAPFEWSQEAGIPDPVRVTSTRGKKLIAPLTFEGVSLRELPRLHLLVKIALNKNQKGHCVASLWELASRLVDSTASSEHTYFLPLTCDGVPRTSTDGRQLHIQFTVSMKVYAGRR